MREGDLVWLMFYFTSRGWLGACASLTREHRAAWCTMGGRQAGGGSVMFGQCSAGKPVIHVDVTLTRTTFLSRRPCAPLHGNSIPWWLWPLSAGWCTLPQSRNLRSTTASLRCWFGLQITQISIQLCQVGCVGHSGTNNTPEVIPRSFRAGCSIFFTPNSGGSLIKPSSVFVINCCAWLISLSSV